jgi:tetratricopeptide (TPR) repeat protein
MSDLRVANNEIDRMWQEAELYEAQGLYDHAKLVYQSILSREPDNREAQVKIVQIQFTQRLEDTTASRRSPDALSPRLALDLGIAYMGMGLYDEALDEFKKAEGAPSPTGTEVSRLAATCLIHLRKFDEALPILTKLLGRKDLEPTKKADIIGEAVGYCLDQGALGTARKLLSQASEEERKFIEDYDVIYQALSAIPAEEEVAPKPAKAVVKPASPPVRQRAADVPKPAPEVPDELADTSIPLQTRVTYSFDNRTWTEGRCMKLASEWAQVQLAEPALGGESLILRIHLPKEGEEEQVWVVSRISPDHPGSQAPTNAAVRVDFVSFLPGGEAALQNFLKEIAKNPSALSAATDSREERVLAEEKLYAQLEERALKAMQEAFLPEPPQQEVPVPPGGSAATTRLTEAPPRKEVGKGSTGQGSKIRFACQCGQVHVVPSARVGRKGTCSNCGTKMIVPVVDPKPDSLAEELVGKAIGGCRLLYKIGGGGMGGVFKAHHLGLDIPVAVKILHAHLATRDPVFVKRFIREARATAKLQHPNVVGVMNVGVEGSIYYIVMPFLGGGSAATLLAKVGKLPAEKVLGIAIDITRALKAAEEHKMLHRDIKPANILLTEKGEAKLADLGLAKSYLDAQDTGITQTGIACGTPLYFSPEQAKGAKNLDIRSDVYSLGITLYHLLDGSPPFKGESAYVIFQKHVHDPLPPLEGVDQRVAGAIFALLQKMTAKDRNERYKNSDELMLALEDVKKKLETPPLPPPKLGLLERLGIRRPK